LILNDLKTISILMTKNALPCSCGRRQTAEKVMENDGKYFD